MTTRYDPERHHRRSLRLKDYDYASAGAYFITICTQDRTCLFGEVDGGGVVLNDAGKMVAEMWDSLPSRFPHVVLDAVVVMPNHIHGIIIFAAPVGAPPVGAPPVGAPAVGAPAVGAPAVGAPAVGAPLVGAQFEGALFSDTSPERAPTRAPTRGAPTVGSVVGAYKSLTTVEFIRGVKTLGWPRFRGRLWQRNFYEHVIRDDASLNRIREYIANNPARWADDPENPAVQTRVGQ